MTSLSLQGKKLAASIVGESRWTRQVRRHIETVAANDVTVLISGGTGTGKELIARAIHEHSPRNSGPLIPVNCAGVSSPLFTSHMFGHVKGAFTGANCDTAGCFRAAAGGTIFLDEIGELQPEHQAKLLRTLQENTITPVGSHQEIPINVRVVAATNRDLKQAVSSGDFREDLYYRIQVVTIETQRLSERTEDIKPLCRHFLAQIAVVRGVELKRLNPAALRVLQAYPWPGNVRELHNVLERAVVFCKDRTITPEHLLGLEATTRTQPADTGFAPGGQETPGFQMTWSGDSWPSVSDMECELVKMTLEHTLYNQTAAAKLLGISRQTLLNKINKFGLDTSTVQPGRPSQALRRRGR